MKLVVTGGAGYIGSVVATMLLEAGHEVIILDNLSNGHLDAVPKGAEFIEADITDFEKHFSRDDHIDAVLHFASLISAGESVKSPEKYWLNNLVGSLSLLDSMRNLGICKLIFSSTAAVYGEPSEIPITEKADKEPTNTYGMTKLAVDMAITSECIAHRLSFISLRYFNVAGSYKAHGERHEPETHIIPLALNSALAGQDFSIYGKDYDTEDGSCVRDYIHVEDLARAHLLALDKLKASTHKIYNLGNGNGFSNLEVVRSVEKVTGKTISLTFGPRRLGDPAILIASSDLAYKELGWKPEKPELETMIKDALEFFESTQR
jgi:UDP-glucose 4-epimerase